MRANNLIKLATKHDDSFAWEKIIPRAKEADGYLISATTLSVILPSGQADGDARRVSVGLFLINSETGKSEYLNVTARWDRDNTVRVCGYPRYFSLHDEGEEFNPDAEYAISRNVEYAIVSDIKRSVQNQFRSKSWKGTLPVEQKKLCIDAFNKALKQLEAYECDCGSGNVCTPCANRGLYYGVKY